VKVPAGEVGWSLTLDDEVTCPDCPMTKKPARNVFAKVDRIIHHRERQYRFTLPGSMPQVLAWVKLLVRVRQGSVQP
jgi:hypothetical protein